MNRARQVAVALAVLLAGAAAFVLIRGTSTPDLPAPVPVEATPAPPPRAPPAAPRPLDEGAYTVTESGLRFHDLEIGSGKIPKPGDVVVVHYTGWLTDGTRFDSSLERGQPIRFPLGRGRVIPGWDEGIAGMREGGHRQLVIPPGLAYGAQGYPPLIPPDATLLFEVELVDVP